MPEIGYFEHGPGANIMKVDQKNIVHYFNEHHQVMEWAPYNSSKIMRKNRIEMIAENILNEMEDLFANRQNYAEYEILIAAEIDKYISFYDKK